MKHLGLLFLALWLTLGLQAQIPGTVELTATIAPAATNSPFGVQTPRYGNGGLLTGASSLAQLQDLNWYPLARRHAFMIATVTNTGAQYINDLTLTNWYNTGSVSNMAQLRLIEPGVGGTVSVDGYYLPGDQGGFFSTLTNSTIGTNEFGGRVLALGGAKSWDAVFVDSVVNAKAFGAKGDNVTDDTSALQAAWTYRNNRPVYVPPGYYRINGTLNITNANASDRSMIFQGAGRADNYSTVFIQDATNSPVILVNGNDTKVGGFLIRFANRPPSTNSNAIGIRIQNSWNGRFENIGVYNANRAIQLQNTYSQFSMLFQDISIYGFSHTGIDCSGTGTQNTWVKVDVRNYGIPGSSTGTASNVGTNVTVTGLSTAFTDNIRTNMVIGITGLSPSEFNGGATVTGVSAGTITYTIGVAPSGSVSGTATVENLAAPAAGQGIFVGSGSQQIFFGLNLEWYLAPRAFTANEFVSIYGLHLEGFTGDGTASSWMRFGEGGEIYGMDVINSSVQPGGSYSLFEVQGGVLNVPVIRARDLCYTGGTFAWYFGAGYMPPPALVEDTTLRWNRTSDIPGELQLILSKGTTNALTKIGDTAVEADAFAWDPTPTGNRRLTAIGSGLQVTDNLTGTTNFVMTLQPNSGISGNLADLNVFTPGFNNRNAFSFINSTNDWWMQYGDGWIRSRRSSTGNEAVLTLQSGHTSQGLAVFSLSQSAGAAAFIPTTDNERIHFTGSRIDGFDNSTGSSRVPLDLNLGSVAVVDEINFANTSGPSIRAGAGAPSASEPNGSLWLRTDGIGPNLYVRENGAWVAK